MHKPDTHPVPVPAPGHRSQLRLPVPGQPAVRLQCQPTSPGTAARGEVLYVHGATFGADLSVFFPFAEGSWADALNQAGFNAWGLDFAGYGGADRYPGDARGPQGRVAAAQAQLACAVAAVHQHGGGRPVLLLAHSWGTLVAGSLAAARPGDVKALALFGPVATRQGVAVADPANPAEPESPAEPETPVDTHWRCSAWAQYRRFVDDVPRDALQVLDEADFDRWAAAYLATDSTSSQQQPPSVLTPFGPLADVAALWTGASIVPWGAVRAPTLLVRGAWDSRTTEADAELLLRELGSPLREHQVIARATHLMHLESGRHALRRCVNDFLLRHC